MIFLLCRSLCPGLFIMCLGGGIGVLGGSILVLCGGRGESWRLLVLKDEDLSFTLDAKGPVLSVRTHRVR